MKQGLLVFIFIIFISQVYGDLDQDLFLAVGKGKLADVQTLIEKGAKVNSRYNKGKTPLHWAAINGDLKIAAYLIGKGAEVDSRDDSRATPLHLCGIKKNLDIVKYLIYKGADINSRDMSGWTPLHYYVYYQNTLFVKYMLYQDADVNLKSSRKFMNIATNSTPLDIAIAKKYTDIQSILENPEVYQSLSRRPVFALSYTNLFGPDDRLIAPEKGIIRFFIANIGGGWSSNTLIQLDSVSNTNGLTFTFNGFTSIAPQITNIYDIPVDASKPTRDGKAFYQLTVSDTNFVRSAEILTVIFETLSPQPPKLEFAMNWNLPDYNRLQGTEKGFLSFQITNSGIGYAEDGYVRIIPVTGCDAILFGNPARFNLKPGGSTNLNMSIEALDTITDGSAIFTIITEDLPMKRAATNTYRIATLHTYKPLLTAGNNVSMSIIPVILTNIFTNWMTNSITNIFAETNANSIATNISPTGTVSILSNIIPAMQTNYELSMQIINTGEAAAKNLKLNTTLMQTTLSNINGSDRYQFTIPDLGTNLTAIIKLPLKIQNLTNMEEMTWSLSGSDEKKWSFVNTNLIFKLGN